MYGLSPLTAARSIFVCGEESELTQSEGQGRVVWALANGEGLTVRQAAQMAGMTQSGVYRMLCRLSRVLPIYCDNHVWQRLEYKELQN